MLVGLRFLSIIALLAYFLTNASTHWLTMFALIKIVARISRIDPWYIMYLSLDACARVTVVVLCCVCVCLCVCVCVCYHTSGYIPDLCVQSEAAYIYCILWTSLKLFRLGDMVLFVCHDDRQLGSFLTKKNTPMVLDTIRNGIVFELLATSDDSLN